MKKEKLYLYKGRFVSSYYDHKRVSNSIYYFCERKFFDLADYGLVPVRSNVSGIFLDHRYRHMFYFLSEENLDINDLIMVLEFNDKRPSVIGKIKEKKCITINLNNINSDSTKQDIQDRWFILNNNPLQKYLKQSINSFNDTRFFNNIIHKILINKDYDEI